MRSLPYLSAILLMACSVQDRPNPEFRAAPPTTSTPLAEALAAKPPRQPKGVILHWQARAGENGRVPHGVPYREAVAHQQRLASLPAAATGPSNWTVLGPGNIGGRIRSILVHPTNPSIMWVGSVSGGVWKSTNGGGTWSMLPDLPAVLAITCMVLHPGDPNTIYAGTGEECFFNNLEGSSNSAVSQGAGLFKSTDGGNSWAQIPSTAGAQWNSVSRLTVDPNNPSIMVASTISGIWRSTDGGNNWSQRTTIKALDVELDPNDSTKYVAGRGDGFAQYSTDGGVTWSNTAAFPNVMRVELEYAKASPGVVFASTSVQGANITLWRSADGGQTYTLQSTGSIVTTLSNYDNALWVDPTNSSRILVGGVDIYRSTNGGTSFTKISDWSRYQQNRTSAHADHHEIVAHPNYDGVNNTTVYFGSDGGIQSAANVLTVTQTTGWTNLNNNLTITQLYGVCMNPTSGVVLGGAQDNGTSRGTPTSGVNGWGQPGGGDGCYCASDPTDPNYFYLQSQYIGLTRSTNAGSSGGSSIRGGINDPNPNFSAYIMLDPNDANRLYVCGAQLWRTNNAKASTVSWTSVKPALSCPNSSGGPPPAHFDNNPPCNISTVTVARGNPNIVWVGHNNGAVYYTTNALAAAPTWTKVDDGAPGLPDRWVSRIAIDHFDHNRVTVSLLGFAPNNVWRTTNSGSTWSVRTGSGPNTLPDVPVSCVTQHRVIGDRYYAATDLGVFYTEDDGLNWLPSAGGPGIVPVEELVWRNDRTLVVGTHGRSIWTCDVDPASINLVGNGCGLSTQPRIAVGAPLIGSPQAYNLSAASPSAPVYLLLSVGPASPIGIGPCVLQPSLQGLTVFPFGTTDGSGALNVNVPIPPNPSFAGVTLTAQEFIAVLGGPLLGIGELSNGAEMTFGF